MEPKLIFLTYDDIRSPVFSSQILIPLRKLQSLGLPHDFVAFRALTTLSDPVCQQRVESVMSDLTGRTLLYTNLPWVGRFDIHHPVISLRYGLRRLGVRPDDHVIIHARGHHASNIALAMKRYYPNLRVIANLRGLAGPEANMSATSSGIPMYRVDRRLMSKFVIGRFNRWERSACEADAVVCVSKAFKEYLRKEYNAPRDRVHVVTTAVDTGLFKYDRAVRERTRQTLGLGSKLVLVFCGSMHEWELPSSALSAVRKALEQSQDVHFLILTTSPADAQVRVDQAGLPKNQVSVHSAPHNKVPDYLTAADVGLLIRESSIVNSVAAPTKFGEYLACGLPVVASAGVGDTAEVVSNYDTGWLIQESQLNDPSVISNTLQREKRVLQSEENKLRCASVGHKLYSWESHTGALLSVYEQLLGSEEAEAFVHRSHSDERQKELGGPCRPRPT